MATLRATTEAVFSVANLGKRPRRHVLNRVFRGAMTNATTEKLVLVTPPATYTRRIFLLIHFIAAPPSRMLLLRVLIHALLANMRIVLRGSCVTHSLLVGSESLPSVVIAGQMRQLVVSFLVQGKPSNFDMNCLMYLTFFQRDLCRMP